MNTAKTVSILHIKLIIVTFFTLGFAVCTDILQFFNLTVTCLSRRLIFAILIAKAEFYKKSVAHLGIRKSRNSAFDRSHALKITNASRYLSVNIVRARYSAMLLRSRRQLQRPK